MKEKIKSYGFWTALAGAMVVLVDALGDLFGFSVSDEIVSGVVMAVAGVLVVLGVVTMPKSEKKEENAEKENFIEDNKTDKEDKEKEGE